MFIYLCSVLKLNGEYDSYLKKMDVCHQSEIEVAFNIEINHWRGTRSPQLQLLDIR